jgi:aryl-alcohol dehydrogenase-like predicted oxidoreductase
MAVSAGDRFNAKSLTEGMKYVKLGTSDLVVSEVCLGTMTFGGQVSYEDSADILNVAFDEYGVNFIDTAEMYPIRPCKETQGRTDIAISKWLKNRKREDVVLASKVLGRSEYFSYIRDSGLSPRVRKSDIIESVDKSLKRLGTDYIDLLQIHWPDRYIPIFGDVTYTYSKERDDDISIEEQLLGLEAVVKSGKVRNIGLSNETAFGVMKFVEIAEHMGLPRVCSLQNSYSLLVRADIELGGLVEVCAPRNANVGILAYSPLAAGVLSGKYQDPNFDTSKSRFSIFENYMSRYLNPQCLSALKEYSDIATEAGLTTTQLALAWCYTRPFITSTIIGVTTVDQLRENLNAYNCPITDEAFDMIRDVYHMYTDPTKMPMKNVL